MSVALRDIFCMYCLLLADLIYNAYQTSICPSVLCLSLGHISQTKDP